MPITRPRASNSGPPELPRLIGASVWIASTSWYSRGQRRDRAPRRRDDADRERRLLAERAADRRDRLADGHRGRVAERDRGERVRFGSTWSTPTSSNRSQPTIFAGDALAVAELDEDLVRALRRRRRSSRLAGVRDHVRVREDVAVVRDDEARALARRRSRMLAEERVDRDDAVRALA